MKSKGVVLPKPIGSQGNEDTGVGEMAQQLSALPAFTEDRIHFSETPQRLTTTYTPNFGDLMSSLTSDSTICVW